MVVYQSKETSFITTPYEIKPIQTSYETTDNVSYGNGQKAKFGERQNGDIFPPAKQILLCHSDVIPRRLHLR